MIGYLFFLVVWPVALVAKQTFSRGLEPVLTALRQPDVVFAFDRRCVLADELGQVAAQLFDVATTGAQWVGRRGIVEQGEQQVFHRDELVTFLPGLNEGHV